MYFLRSFSVMFTDARTSSASSPKQYSSVLTCRDSFSFDNPDANQNWSKRLRHFGHSSGVRKLKGLGALRDMLAAMSPADQQWTTSDTM